MAVRTDFLLLSFYGGRPMIPIDEVCRDFFPHLDVTKLLRKVGNGSIDLPVTRMEASMKTAKMVHVNHLAAYLDRVADAAEKEARQLRRAN